MAKLKANQFEYRPGLVITERPILFQTDMVQAILEGRKTQTRRQIKGQPTSDESIHLKDVFDHNPEYFYQICRYGKPGDLLWVRETWATIKGSYCYKAGMKEGLFTDRNRSKYKPSIHMHKDACRIWLMVEEVRVERLQDISDEDARAEGIKCTWIHNNINYCRYKNYINNSDGSVLPKSSFRSLWISINGEESWDYNPWVWVVKFRVLSKTGRPSREDILSAYVDLTSEEKEVSNG